MVAETQLESNRPSSHNEQEQSRLANVHRELSEFIKDPKQYNSIVSGTRSESNRRAGFPQDGQSNVTHLDFGRHDIYHSDSSSPLPSHSGGKFDAAKNSSRVLDSVTSESEKPGADKKSNGSKALTPSEFAETSKQLFGNLDQNHDGTLTKAEVAKAMENPSIRGKDAQALAALYNNFDTLSRLHGSITPASLDRFTELMANSKKPENADAGKKFERVGDLLKKPEALFGAKYDRLLSMDNIEHSLTDSKYTDTEKKGFQYLKDHFSELSEGKAGVGLAGIVHKACDLEAIDKLPDDLVDIAKHHNANASQDLYNRKELQPINPNAVQQGQVGDCYFLAAVASVAKTNPDAIKQMIKENGDGTYTVSFPGDAGHHKIVVNKPTEAEAALYNGGSKYGTWATVLEKAYGQLGKIHKDLGDDTTSSMGIKDGGWSAQPLYLLTGHVANEKAVRNTSTKEMLSILQDAEKNNKAVTVGSNPDGPDATTAKMPEGYISKHEFTFMGLSENGQGGWDVILRNPWGTATDNTNNGVFKIPLEKLMDKNLFDSVTIDK